MTLSIGAIPRGKHPTEDSIYYYLKSDEKTDAVTMMSYNEATMLWEMY